MPNVTKDTIFELLRWMQADISSLKEGQRHTRHDMSTLRDYIQAMHGDINGIRAEVALVVQSIDHIEVRLGRRELSEARISFQQDK